LGNAGIPVWADRSADPSGQIDQPAAASSTEQQQMCPSEPLPEVIHLADGEPLQRGFLHLVKGPHVTVMDSFPQTLWQDTFGGSVDVALVAPVENVSWPPDSYSQLPDSDMPDPAGAGGTFNAWRILKDWRDPFAMFSPLDKPIDVTSLGVMDRGTLLSAQALDHLNHFHSGQNRHAWIYLKPESGPEQLLGQLEIADPARISVVIPARGEVEIRTHDSTIWWAQCQPPPSIAVTKTANPESRPEPGGVFEFRIRVENTSSVDLTLTSLQDDVYGDVVQGNDPRVRNTTCSVGVPIPRGQFYECAFNAEFRGEPGDRQTDVVVATARDQDGRQVQAQDEATVRIENVPSAIEVIKTASPYWMVYPGGDVTFRVTIKSLATVDKITINSLVDTVYGDLDGRGNCSVPQTLPVGGSYTCSFTAEVTGQPNTTHTNVVTASGVDEDGQPVSDDDSATVTIAIQPTRVELLSFTATPGTSGIAVEWETAWEQDSWGFNIYRGLTPNFLGAALIQFEPAQGSEGKSYGYEDSKVSLGQEYFYWLEDVDVAGETTLHGPAAATLPIRVFIPIVTR
jgi:hypothetical protein